MYEEPEDVTPPNKNAAIVALIILVGKVNINVPKGVLTPLTYHGRNC